MALLFLDGFEGYPTINSMFESASTTKWQGFAVNNPSLSSTVFRTTQVTSANSRSLTLTPGSTSGLDMFTFSFPAKTEIIVGFGFRFSSSASGNSFGLISIGGTDFVNQGVTLRLIPSTGALTVGTSGSQGPDFGALLGTSSTSLAINTWYYIEMRLLVGSTTGQVELYINGTQTLNLTNVNTATGSISSYGFLSLGTANHNASSPIFYYDDFYLIDTSGATNNTFLGQISVYSLMPTAAGTSTQFTPSGVANNWDAVNDATSDDVATYVSTTTTGHQDFYTFEDLPGGVTTVAGVQVKGRSTVPISSASKVKYNLKNGASTISSNLKPLSLGSWLYDFFVSDTAPDGSAWTPAKVNSTEGGVESA